MLLAFWCVFIYIECLIVCHLGVYVVVENEDIFQKGMRDHILFVCKTLMI